MRILILGAGGVGGYFGGRLAACGADVTFLVRAARAQYLKQNGLTIHSPLGNAHISISTITEVSEEYDAILLSCKAYDLTAGMNAIAPAVGKETLILPLLNGILHLETLDDKFQRRHVLGGLCHIGVTLTPEGEIEHLNNLHRLALGARMPEQEGQTAVLFDILRQGGFETILSDAITQDMWGKFVFLTAYAALTTLMRAPIGVIQATDEGEAIATEMLAECVSTARAWGHVLPADDLAQMQKTLSEVGSKGTASMYRDIQRGHPTEHEHIIGDMLRRARAADIATPLLRMSFAHLQAYEILRQGNQS